MKKKVDSAAAEIGIEAYVYGYPLVTMEITRRVMTNVAAPQGAHAPMGQFLLMRKYPDAAFKDVTAPNADTLYSTAWLDLAKEPYVLRMPDNPLNRYTISPQNDLKYNEDGSLDVYIQNESPGKNKESNWLPAPKGKFVLMMRLYWPKETAPSIIDGTWKPPGVKAVAP